MNQQQIEAIAQTISTLSDEDRQALEQTLQQSNGSGSTEQTNNAREVPEQETLSDFFEAVKAIRVEGGPPDWSSRINDYLNEDAVSEHD